MLKYNIPLGKSHSYTRKHKASIIRVAVRSIPFLIGLGGAYCERGIRAYIAANAGGYWAVSSEAGLAAENIKPRGTKASYADCTSDTGCRNAIERTWSQGDADLWVEVCMIAKMTLLDRLAYKRHNGLAISMQRYSYWASLTG